MDPTTTTTYVYGRSAADDLLEDWDLLPSVSAATPLSQEARSEDRAAEEKSKFKSRLVSAWNSVKYGPLLFPPTHYLLVVLFYSFLF